MTQTFKLTDRQEAVRDQIADGGMHGLIYGGSRSGKTALECYVNATRAIKAPKSRHLMLRRYQGDARKAIGGDTFPKIASMAYPDVKWDYNKTDGVFIAPNEAEIWIGGLDDDQRVEKILGNEYATITLDEASQISFQSYLVAKTRLAQKVSDVDGRLLRLRMLISLNPTTTSHWTHGLFHRHVMPDGTSVEPDDYWWAKMNPGDNAENLTPEYLAQLAALPREMRRRFFEGEYGADDPHALWRRSYFRREDRPATLQRIVVAIDPAASSKPGSDETGLVVAASDAAGNGYVLADESGKYRPEEWARRAIALYDLFGADRIIGEVNNGGDMVEAIIRAQRANVSYRAVHASRGKVTRAEPVAALYELGKVSHCGEFPELEDQCCAVTSDFDRNAQGWSPDRVDALVWAMTEIFPDIAARVPEQPPAVIPSGGIAMWR